MWWLAVSLLRPGHLSGSAPQMKGGGAELAGVIGLKTASMGRRSGPLVHISRHGLQGRGSEAGQATPARIAGPPKQETGATPVWDARRTRGLPPSLAGAALRNPMDVPGVEAVVWGVLQPGLQVRNGSKTWQRRSEPVSLPAQDYEGSDVSTRGRTCQLEKSRSPHTKLSLTNHRGPPLANSARGGPPTPEGAPGHHTTLFPPVCPIRGYIVLP